MKTSIITAVIAIIALSISSCGTGLVVEFGKDGNIRVTPPDEPILIPTK